MEEMHKAFGIGESFSETDLLLALHRSNAASAVRNISAECYFVKHMEELGLPVEAEDGAYTVFAGPGRFVFRCCVLTQHVANFENRYSQSINLPASKKPWKSFARQKKNCCDFVAICLEERTGSFKDFVYLYKDFIPSYHEKKEESKFLPEDRVFLAENFYATRIHVPITVIRPFITDLRPVLC